eukprot:scaffold473_cov104-Isochrysis_galbana.AAC.7
MAPCLVLIGLWVGGGRGMCVGESARGYYICVHVPSNRHLLLMVSQKCDAFASVVFASRHIVGPRLGGLITATE